MRSQAHASVRPRPPVCPQNLRAAGRRARPLAAASVLVALGASGQAAYGSPEPNNPDNGGLPAIHFGAKVGLAIAMHQGIEARDMEYEVSSATSPGVAAGLFMVLPVTRRFALQSEFLYVQKGSRQDIGVEILGTPTVLDVAYDLDYLEFPTLFRFNWVIDRAVDVYTLAGFTTAIKVKDRYRLDGLVDDGTATVPIFADADMSEVDRFDFVINSGIGMEVPVGLVNLVLEYRYDLSIEALPLPTYGDAEIGGQTVRVDNPPVALRNHAHLIFFGARY